MRARARRAARAASRATERAGGAPRSPQLAQGSHARFGGRALLRTRSFAMDDGTGAPGVSKKEGTEKGGEKEEGEEAAPAQTSRAPRAPERRSRVTRVLQNWLISLLWLLLVLTPSHFIVPHLYLCGILAYSCGKEALGKGSKHVKGMYAVFGLLSLSGALGELAVLSMIAGAALASPSAHAGAGSPGVGAGQARGVFQSLGQGFMSSKSPEVAEARNAFQSIGLSLYCAMAGAFVAAVVVWVGTGICVACGALVRYWAAAASRSRGSY